jgi:ATP-binding cassette subfamily B protein
VVFWNFNHFLVLDGIEADRFWINDPATGRRSVDLEEFDRCYTGVVLTMEPGEAFVPSEKRPGALQELLKWLSQSKRNTRFACLGCLALSAALLSQTTAALALPWPALTSLIGMSLAVIPVSQALARELERRLRQSLQQQLLLLPDWVLQQHFSSELSGRLGRVSELSAELRVLLGQSLPLVLGMTVWSFVLLFREPGVGLIVCAGVVLWLSVRRQTVRQQRSAEARARLSMSRAGLSLQGSLQDPATIKASALEHDLFLRWGGLEAIATRERQRLVYTRDLQDWVPRLILWCLPMVLFSASGTVALLVGSLGLALALERSSAFWQSWGGIQQAIRSIKDLEEQPRDPLVIPHQASENMPEGPASISLESVDFGYVPVLPPLIKGLNLSVKPGQRIALVGGSASGKSTVARLIAGLLQPSAGVVRINSKPMLELSKPQRCRTIAMVQQGMPMLSASVRENLTLFDPDIDERAIQRACVIAGIWERVQKLPQGLETALGQGGQKLSGGEQQRLQIAQALLQRPALLILDEATSALDARTEAQVETALKDLGCTQVVVAHRLSTIRDADEILVMDQGSLVQQGTHQALLEEEGSPYQKLLLLDGVPAKMEGIRQGNGR